MPFRWDSLLNGLYVVLRVHSGDLLYAGQWRLAPLCTRQLYVLQGVEDCG